MSSEADLRPPYVGLIDDYVRKVEQLIDAAEAASSRLRARIFSLSVFLMFSYVMVFLTSSFRLGKMSGEEQNLLIVSGGLIFVLALMAGIVTSYNMFMEFRRNRDGLEDLLSVFKELIDRASQLSEQGSLDDQSRFVVRAKTIEAELAFRKARRVVQRETVLAALGLRRESKY